MDTLHRVMRSISGETKEHRRDHLAVFREFLGHLDRINKPPRPPRASKAKPVKRR